MAVRGLGAVDLTTGQALPWAPQFSRPVGELVVSGQTLHASGGFNLVDGVNRSGVASFDLATLAPSTVFTARGQSAVSGIAADGDGGLWIGGEMTDWGGVPVAGVVHLRADGSIDPDMPRLNGSGRVYALTVSAGQLFLGGFFRSVDGVPRDLMASVRLDDRSVTRFRPNLDESIYALAPAPGGVIAGGDFRMTELTPRLGPRSLRGRVLGHASGPGVAAAGVRQHVRRRVAALRGPGVLRLAVVRRDALAALRCLGCGLRAVRGRLALGRACAPRTPGIGSGSRRWRTTTRVHRRPSAPPQDRC